MRDRVFSIYKLMHKSRNKYLRNLIHYYLRVVYSCDIMPETIIGEGTRFAHCGLGVVINSGCTIGNNCIISKGAVIGGRSGLTIVPQIGNNVLIGANAVVIGPITIGDNAQIGAGAVVLHDVPPGGVCVGNPGKVIKTV